MIFAALPPEIISGWMYTGPGVGPMMAAAGAWNGLGSELGTTAIAYQSVITALTTEEWLGPTAMTMATSLAPYVTWMFQTAEAAEQAGAQAMASAAAYESAFAMTVPPPVIAANRVQLATLVATNILGQNTAAIAATEAHYAEMWAQDASAMYGYLAASAAAAQLTPLSAPTGPHGTGVAAPAATGQAGLSQLVDQLPAAMQQLNTAISPTTLGNAASSITPAGFLGDLVNSTGGVGLWNGATTVTNAAGNIVSWNVFTAIAAAVGNSASAAGRGVVPTATAQGLDLISGASGGPTATPHATVAALGDAYEVDGLSVPPSWAATAPPDLDGAPDLDGSDGVVLADAAEPASADGFTIPSAAGFVAAGALAPMALRNRRSADVASPSLLSRSKARKRKTPRRRAQPKAE
ncbi:PPE domain-containing protein [Mycobacterium koreense]|uniref:PPE family protein n=1 Tax=Mycolicibacillus koreensis TaxID=1069220 RepID=A0A7I7SK62_9MYCO|nr:PPE family protein [Mycolicibacillus koreensis]MCV7250518.1 PPE domain-containing protein [Mycolicibacillus koreensis]ODR04814.1 hypothetical protein BHQ15_16520 [Mycolicibacillus koreensis]OSC32764.1 PPE family protein [Mycolicibacillus koreensis]BBY56385.1 PPE family protein [Mycolicibacillus koreensis]